MNAEAIGTHADCGHSTMPPAFAKRLTAYLNRLRSQRRDDDVLVRLLTFDIESRYYQCMAKAAELLHGTLNLLFLRTLELRPLHGVGMADRIEQVTHGVFVVGPGFLFPAQHRLAEEGWITGKWREVENGRRAKFYDLTTAGRAQRPRICLTLRWLRTKTAHKLLGLSQVSECTEAEEAWRWRTA